MRKTFKKIITAISILILATTLISCGKGADNNVPTEVVKTYIESYLKSKDIDYEKTKTDKVAMEDLVNKRDYNLSTILGFDGESNEGDFLKAFYSALSKVEYDVASNDIEKDTATVSLDIKGINLQSLKTNSYKAMLEEKKNKKMTPEELTAFYENFIINSLNNINLDESKTLELTLNKDSNNEWKLTDDSLTKLESAITIRDSYERLTSDVPDSFKEIIEQAS